MDLKDRREVQECRGRGGSTTFLGLRTRKTGLRLSKVSREGKAGLTIKTEEKRLRTDWKNSCVANFLWKDLLT